MCPFSCRRQTFDIVLLVVRQRSSCERPGWPRYHARRAENFSGPLLTKISMFLVLVYFIISLIAGAKKMGPKSILNAYVHSTLKHHGFGSQSCAILSGPHS